MDKYNVFNGELLNKINLFTNESVKIIFEFISSSAKDLGKIICNEVISFKVDKLFDNTDEGFPYTIYNVESLIIDDSNMNDIMAFTNYSLGYNGVIKNNQFNLLKIEGSEINIIVICKYFLVN